MYVSSLISLYILVDEPLVRLELRRLVAAQVASVAGSATHVHL